MTSVESRDRPTLFDHTPDSLRQWCRGHDRPGYLADQILGWVYGKHVVEPAMMTDLSKRDRDWLRETLAIDSSDLLAHQVATDGTEKLLLGWREDLTHRREPVSDEGTALPMLTNNTDAGRQTETVMIPTERRRTACVSSQVGCPVGCAFCASGLGGLEGNLRAGQIVEQIHRLNRLERIDRITNVVFMGMGEPLANYRAVTDAIRTINAPWGLGIGARRITVSTVGLPAAIRKLSDFELPITLALSLHAPDDDLRRELIPWSQYTTIDELLDACDEYFRRTGREITLEYILLGGLNDQPEHAEQVARIARRLRANVNLIRYNEVEPLPYQRPQTNDVRQFQEILRRRHVNAHIRASRGRDIAAACGQLRHERRAAEGASEGPSAAASDHEIDEAGPSVSASG